MIPLEHLGKTKLPDGDPVELYRRGDIWFIQMERTPLWSSETPACPEAMVSLGCETIARRKRQPRVLLQDLGLGQALRRALAILPLKGRVTVSEVCEGVVAWHRGLLSEFSENALQDDRLTIECQPLTEVLRANEKEFDAVLIDDEACFYPFFEDLSSSGKLRNAILLVKQALRESGLLVIRTERKGPNLDLALEKAGFSVRHEFVSPSPSGKGRQHCITLAKRMAGSAEPTD